MKIFGITMLVILGLVVLSAIGSALNLITIPWLKFDSQVQMTRDINTKTYSADNAIYNYHWFQQQAQDIKTASENIDVASSSLASYEAKIGPTSGWTYAEQTEDANLTSILQGQRQYYNGLVNDYNARAGEADRSIFQNGLPIFFNLQPY